MHRPFGVFAESTACEREFEVASAKAVAVYCGVTWLAHSDPSSGAWRAGCMALAMKLPSGVGRAEEVGHWDALACCATSLRDAAGAPPPSLLLGALRPMLLGVLDWGLFL